jgi:hypothetical protein
MSMEPCKGCLDEDKPMQRTYHVPHDDETPVWGQDTNPFKGDRHFDECVKCTFRDTSSSDIPCNVCLYNDTLTSWQPFTKAEPVKEPVMSNSTALPAIEEADALTNAFEYLNEELFDGELGMVKLGLTRNPRVKKGHFAPDAWVDEDGVKWHEIVINAQWYAEVQDFRLAMTTLVHEMGHLEQHENGTQGRETYHNVEYVTRMRDMGVDSLDMDGNPVSSGDRVSSALIPGGKLEKALMEMPEEYIFPYLPFLAEEEPPQHAPPVQSKEPKPKKRGVKSKYVCAQCGNAAWGKPSMRIGCLECNREMIEG